MEGQEFSDVNQVLQWIMVYENRAKEPKSYNRFKGTSTNNKPDVNCVDKDLADEEETEVCVTEWVDTAEVKPLACSFLKPTADRKEEVKFTFDVSKRHNLFDVLL
jgi:hypothetical protein